jgi:hypothetical protein
LTNVQWQQAAPCCRHQAARLYVQRHLRGQCESVCSRYWAVCVAVVAGRHGSGCAGCTARGRVCVLSGRSTNGLGTAGSEAVRERDRLQVPATGCAGSAPCLAPVARAAPVARVGLQHVAGCMRAHVRPASMRTSYSKRAKATAECPDSRLVVAGWGLRLAGGVDRQLQQAAWYKRQGPVCFLCAFSAFSVCAFCGSEHGRATQKQRGRAARDLGTSPPGPPRR